MKNTQKKENNFASLCLDNTCNEKKHINKSYNIQIFFNLYACISLWSRKEYKATNNAPPI